MIGWAFTDMSDPRWSWDRRYITLKQANAGPTKVGLAHRENWVAYHNGDSLFLKTIEHLDGATYPDLGCNFEPFTNEEMLEVEALGPLVELAPGASTKHTEQWHLFEGSASRRCTRRRRSPPGSRRGCSASASAFRW